MSKRKYGRDVSQIAYGWEWYVSKEIGNNAYSRKGTANIPVRVIRESFYRRLVEVFERYAGEREIQSRM